MIRHTHYGPEEILRALQRRRWVVLGALWVAVAATLLYTRSLPDRFESEVRIQLVPPNVTEQYVSPAVRLTLGERLPSITDRVLNSDRLQEIVGQLGLYQAEKTGANESIARIRRDFRYRVASSDSFVITYTAGSPGVAHDVANRLGQAFVDENRRRSEAMAGATTDFLDAQLEDTRGRLEENEKKLAAFNAQHTGELPAQLQSNLQLLQNAQTQLQTLRDALGRDRDEALSLDRMIQDTMDDSRAAPSGSAVPVLAPAEESPSQKALRDARAELQDLQSRLRSEHPDVIRATRHLVELETQVAAERLAAQPAATSGPPAGSPRRNAPANRDPRVVQLRVNRDRLERQIASRQAEEARLREQIEEYSRRVESTPERESELTGLMRDYDTLKGIYAKLLAKKEESRISANLQENEIGEQFVIILPASTPARPASPNRLQLTTVGTLAGMLLALGLAVVLEYQDSSFRTEHELVALLSVPPLATIPVMLPPAQQRWERSKVGLLWAAVAGVALTVAVAFWQAVR